MSIDVNLLQNACIAADDVAIRFQGTDSERTRAVVQRALEALEANGLITVVPEEDRPFFFAPFPPYNNGLSKVN